MKYFILIAFIAILASLACALYFMMKNGGDGEARARKMVRSLAFRVGLSILLFVGVLLAWKLGLIQPTGIQAGQ